MFKIDSDGATASNTFTEGNAGTGVQATRVSADWLNAIQAELVNAVESAGLTLDKTDSHQLRKAAGKVGRVATNTTISVPSDYATIQLALDSLAGRYIERTATVTIQVADGTHTVTAPIYVSHPQGERIVIQGNATTPANCTLNIAMSVITAGAGFLNITKGAKLGGFNGFVVSGDYTSGATANKHGIYVTEAASLTCGPNLTIKKFAGEGLFAYRGGIITAVGVISRENANNGFLAQWGSKIYAETAQAISNVNGAGFRASFHSCIYGFGGLAESNPANAGFLADGNSIIECSSSTSRKNFWGYRAIGNSAVEASNSISGGPVVGDANTSHGFAADFGATIYAPNATSRYNGGSGYYAERNSQIVATGVTSANNTGWGFEAVTGAFIVQTSANNTGNTAGAASPAVASVPGRIS